MELLAEMELTGPEVTFPRYENRFLTHLQEAAQRHLSEKSQIRDTLALLQIYHRAGECGEKRENVAVETSTVDLEEEPMSRRWCRRRGAGG